MHLSVKAVEQLRGLLAQPEPKLIRVGVKNRGCSGLAYHLEYVDKPGAFAETVEQDGVKVLIDSNALFSIIGSEMDWVEDKLNERFVFKNPNISTYHLPFSLDCLLTFYSGTVWLRRIIQHIMRHEIDISILHDHQIPLVLFDHFHIPAIEPSLRRSPG